MTELEKAYNPAELEKDLYGRWENNGCFSASQNAGSQPYCIMIPPPNVTGSLHMGHAFQQTLMDILIRYHRMKGDQTLWQVGTDHAGIATQMVVERQLPKETSRHTLGRQPFIDKIWEWKKESGGNITRQLRRIGASVDWSRERFTLDEGLSEAVKKVFVRLYDEKLIYRGKRLVNWDPVLKTAVSDLEVESEEQTGSLWYIQYPLQDDPSEKITIATTRPETLLGDVAVAVHPEDKRYAHLVGKMLSLPLTDRLIPVISDPNVEPEFGTGCVKITPAHDFNDYEMGKRHKLPQINILNLDATLNENVSETYRGLDRFVARKKILDDLKKLELLEKTEKHTLSVPKGDRSGAVLEPLLTDQWFVKVDSLAKPAIEAVEQNKIRFVPENWSKTYFEWMRNIQDWCISRQLWWGHQIPAWYDLEGNLYVAENETAVREKYDLSPDFVLKQDEDVLDTWFSSALWPFSTLGWPENTEELKKFYPTQVLVTGFDIIFFWVARMIMFGLKFTDNIPFQEVYIHGLIQDQDGQKMSKTKGNVLDPIDLIDGITLDALIEKRTRGLMQPQLAEQIKKKTEKQFPKGIPAHGTDALRFTFAMLATTGRHIRFDLSRIEGYKHFCNKLWNAARYVLLNTHEHKIIAPPVGSKPSIIHRWILSAWQNTKQAVHSHLTNYRFDLAAQALYEFTWNEYCDWYLELSKPALNSNDPEEVKYTRYTLLALLEELLRTLHPFIPYITETIWQRVGPLLQKTGNTIMLQPYPECDDKQIDNTTQIDMDWIKAFILGIRNIRGEMNINPSKLLPVFFNSATEDDRRRLKAYEYLLKPLAKLDSILPLPTGQKNTATALVGTLELLVPMEGLIDKAAEINRLEKEIGKLAKEHSKLTEKLNNESFLDRAPKNIVDEEKKRHQALESSIKQLQEKCSTFKSV